MAPYLTLYEQALTSFCTDVRSRLKKEDDERQLQQFLHVRSSPQQAKESAVALKQDAGKKYGPKKIGDSVVIKREWIDNIVGNISNAIDVGNTMLKGAPESVSMAWFCVKLGLSAIQSDYDLYSLFGSGLTSVTELMVLIPHYDTLYDQRREPGFISSELVEKMFRDIVTVYAAILDFMFSIKRHVEAGAVAKIRHAFKDFFGAEVIKFQAKQNNIAILKAKVLEDSDAAFQSRLFDQLGDVQNSLKTSLDNIRTFTATAAELAQGQSDLLKSMQDIKALVKPRTRWDFLKQDFDTYKKQLDPLPEVLDGMKSLLGRAQEGTSTWIFETKSFNNWVSPYPDRGSLLCLIGKEGVGKSTVVASTLDKLERDLDATTHVICFLSCVKGDGRQNDIGSHPLNRIRNSLIYQVYKLALEDEEKPGLLEDCNKVFQHPKRTEKQQGLAAKGKDDEVPALCEALSKLAALLKRHVVVVLDAIDSLSDQDQDILFNDLLELFKESEDQQTLQYSIRVLASCRSGKSFANTAIAKDCYVDIGLGNQEDMKAKLSSELSAMPNWTEAEKLEASETVMEKAGPRFSYIVDVAIPFLREPFQRPLSNRLALLPEDITDSYKQAIRNMQPNYLDLLRTALTWTLYMMQPVRVKEIMEAYTGVYEIETELDVPEDYARMFGFNASQLEIQQMQGACETFLRISNNSAKQSVVVLQDVTQIRKFCGQAEGHDVNVESQEGTFCKKCKAELSSVHDMVLTEKQVHLRMARQCLRHLNSPLFQRRFDLMSQQTSNAGVSSTQELPDGEVTSPKAEIHPQGVVQEIALREQSSIPPGQAANEVPISNGNTDGAGKHGLLINDEDIVEPPERVDNYVESTPDGGDVKPSGDVGNDEGYDTDDSREDEDNGEIKFRKYEIPTIQDEAYVYDGSGEPRYEIFMWVVHLREADRLWTAEEKAASPEWNDLFKVLDVFAFDNEGVFKKWQARVGSEGTSPYLEKGVGALHVAARLGLTSWAEHLIRVRGIDPNELSGACTAIQAAAMKALSRDMLRLLLDQPGTDATASGDEEPGTMPALHSWLTEDSSTETVQVFLDRGANFAVTWDETNESCLHYFALQGDDPDALELLLQSGDADRRPDINQKNKDKDTPLHFLLSRREVPVDLLKKFIEKGADVNAENRWSIRPLQSACDWSDEELVKVILEQDVTDVNDPDSNGDTALHSAACSGGTECVRALLSKNANPEIENKAGRRALNVAARYGHKEAAQALIDHGAKLNEGDKHSRTPFWWACNSESMETASLLLESLVEKFDITEINKPSKRLRTPLRMAATHGFAEIVEKLINMTLATELDVKAMLDIQDTRMGQTALHRAAWRGQLACVKIILDNGANAELQDEDGKTALTLATEQWQSEGGDIFEEIVFLLIDKTQAHLKTYSELPATAAANGSVKILERLNRLGADVNRVDSFGWTPLTLAQRLGHTDVERFLKHQTAWGGALPSAWVKHTAIADRVEVTEDGLGMIFRSDTKCCIVTNKPLPAGLDRFYFEMTSVPMPDEEDQPPYPIVAIGFCTHGATSLHFPGWPSRTTAARSWAYHGDDGFLGDSTEYGPSRFSEKYKPGDTVGCGVDLEKQIIWYTKNGKKLALEHSGVSGRLFPVIGLDEKVRLETNFGGKKPFSWPEANVDEKMTASGPT